MADHKVGMRYLGGWGGDFESEIGPTAMPTALPLTTILKQLRKRSLKDRESIYRRWHKRYEELSEGLLSEEDHKKFLEEDRYMNRIKRNLGL
ncbi:hypothetical protein ACFL5G_02070 [Candidatus Margulisiibacteriota bacterium]